MILRRSLLFGATAAALQGGAMDRFGMSGKMLAKPGQRDALLEILLDASRAVSSLPGCDVYIISVSPNEPDAILVYEAWRSEADHDASLKLESVRALIAKAKPLIAGFADSARFVPVGGKGIPTA